jgi:hypothetical protein
MYYPSVRRETGRPSSWGWLTKGLKSDLSERGSKPDGRKSRLTSKEAIERQVRLTAVLSMRLEGHSKRAIGESMDPPVTAQAIGRGQSPVARQ